MRMTTDDHIEVLKSYNHGFTGYAGNLQNSINVAIDTMRKYQKMQEVLERIWNIPSHLINKEQCLDRIMETYKEIREGVIKMDISIGHRLKTIDMMSILVDIQTELYEELYEVDINDTLSPSQVAWNDALYKAGNIVQKKINSLKEAKDGENNN